MNIDNVNKVYLVGVGGIGMSALARYFNYTGKKVAGYDRASTELTKKLILEGIDIHFIEGENIPEDYKNPQDTLVVYTPAVPHNHPELQYFRDNDFNILKRSDILGLLTNNMSAIAVAGTHGKTTVSTMIAHILSNSTIGCNAFEDCYNFDCYNLNYCHCPAMGYANCFGG